MKRELLSPAMAPNPYEVSINYKRPAFDEMKCVFGSSDANTLMREFIDCESLDYKEKSWLICMTTSNRVLSISLIGTGSVASTIIPIHEVAQTSLLLHASRVIIIHSHSSGSLIFSYADKQITKRIKKGLKLLSIELLDHLILTTESYASMADEGLL